jgi:hypothetical protein
MSGLKIMTDPFEFMRTFGTNLYSAYSKNKIAMHKLCKHRGRSRKGSSLLTKETAILLFHPLRQAEYSYTYLRTNDKLKVLKTNNDELETLEKLGPVDSGTKIKTEPELVTF